MAQHVPQRQPARVRQRRQPRRHGLVEVERATLGQQAEQRGGHRLGRRGEHEAVVRGHRLLAVQPARAGGPHQRPAAPDGHLRAGHAGARELLRHGLPQPSRRGGGQRTVTGADGRGRHRPRRPPRARQPAQRARAAPRPPVRAHAYAAAPSSASAASTTSSCVLGDTFGNTFATVPSGAMRNVDRCTPQYVLP